MSVLSPTALPADSDSGEEPLKLVCQEIWGGNRAAATPVQLPGVRGWLYAQPCQSAAGGDLHYLSVCGSGMLSRMCVADVAGHGEAVAATSHVMHQHLRRCVNRTDQRRVLKELNSLLIKEQVTQLATTAMVSYFPPTRGLSYSYAGHEPAWFYDSRKGSWKRLEPPARRGLSDLPLSVDTNVGFTQTKRRVNYGDRLVLMTDGVQEAPNHRGELFGTERLRAVLEMHRERSCADLIAELNGAIERHMAGTVRGHDDLTILAVEFVNDDRVPALWRAIWNRLTAPRGNSASYR